MVQKSQAEPSMDDILASIRRIISEEPARDAPPPPTVPDTGPGTLSARLNDVFGPATLPTPVRPMAVRDPFEDDLGGLIAPMAAKPNGASSVGQPLPGPQPVLGTIPAATGAVAQGQPAPPLRPAPAAPVPQAAPRPPAAGPSIPASAQPLAAMPPAASLTAAPATGAVSPAPAARPQAPVVIAAMPQSAAPPPPAAAFELSSLSPANRSPAPAVPPRPEPVLRAELVGRPADNEASSAAAPPLFPGATVVAATSTSPLSAFPAPEQTLASLRTVDPVAGGEEPSSVLGLPSLSAAEPVASPPPPSAAAPEPPAVSTITLALSGAPSAAPAPSAAAPVAPGTANPAPAPAPKAAAAPAAPAPAPSPPKPPAAKPAAAPPTAAAVKPAPSADASAKPAEAKAKAPAPPVAKTAAAPTNAAPTNAVAAKPTPPPAVQSPPAVQKPPAQSPEASKPVAPVEQAALEPMASLPALVPSPGQDLAVPAGFDDTAADLLRPMLRQWLDSNMPRIVEKALRRELAENPPAALRPEATHGDKGGGI
ncbi:MAG: DUF2497 domain-containing protein [Hyphomicrobiaceae bacterium]|nr:DUF2497 domain-containing protein [Hyphomicrobiaceae bacterium]